MVSTSSSVEKSTSSHHGQTGSKASPFVAGHQMRGTLEERQGVAGRARSRRSVWLTHIDRMGGRPDTHSELLTRERNRARRGAVRKLPCESRRFDRKATNPPVDEDGTFNPFGFQTHSG